MLMCSIFVCLSESRNALVMTSIGIPVTIGVLFDEFIIDPTREEEIVLDGSVTVVVSSDDQSLLFLSQNSNTNGLDPEKLLIAIDIATSRSKDIYSIMHTSC